MHVHTHIHTHTHTVSNPLSCLGGLVDKAGYYRFEPCSGQFRFFFGNLADSLECLHCLTLPLLAFIVLGHIEVKVHVLSPALQLTGVACALMDQMQSDKQTDAERNQKIIRIIFAGIMEMILTGIEDSRRARTPLFVPKYSAFVKYLSAGSGV